MVAIEPAPLSETGLYDKIGGWLVFVAIGTYLTPFFMAYASYDHLQYYSDQIARGAQEILVGFGLMYAALAIGWLYACILLTRLDPLFPKIFIAMLVVTFAANFLNVAITSSYTGASPTIEDNKPVIRAFMQGIIWIPYVLVSKRVKATFYGVPMPVIETAPRLEHSMPASNRSSELSMVQRFGMVLYWLSWIFAAICAIAGVVGIANSHNGSDVVGYVCFGAAVVSWLIGRALKYVLVGR